MITISLIKDSFVNISKGCYFYRSKCFLTWITYKRDVIILIKANKAHKWFLRPVTDEGLATYKNLYNVAYKNGQFDHGFDER